MLLICWQICIIGETRSSTCGLKSAHVVYGAAAHVSRETTVR